MGPEKNISNEDLDRHLEDAVKAARTAGPPLLELADRVSQINDDGRDDFVAEADEVAHACIYDSLFKTYPDYAYLSIASEDLSVKKEGFLWILDPLVGTTNFAYGFPYYAISVALVIDGVITVGVIYDPAADELFTAIKGQGAFLNDKPIQVTDTSDLNRSFLSQRFPYDVNDGGLTNLGLFNHLIKKSKAIQSANSATMDLALVAAGRLDGFWELRLSAWDLVAGVLLIEEAGGKVTDLSGGPYFIDSEELLATNGRIHEAMLEAITEVPKESW